MEDQTKKQDKDDRTLLVVDGHSLAFRAFYALPVESFTTSTGQPTNAVWGFATMLADVMAKEKPTHMGVAFDVKGGTFRNAMLPQYKGTREAAPKELLSQLPLIQDLLKGLGITYIEKPGYEGDDIIGTLATMGEQAGFKTLVLSGDRDAFQLVDDDITVLYPGHHFKNLKHMTPQAIMDRYKVTPQQYPDLAAMRGEGADNIPGVPGVGDGYAAKWINKYGSLDSILEHADEIGGKKGQALAENADQVRLNRKVNALVRDLDLGVKVEDLHFGTIHTDQVLPIFEQLQFGPQTRKKILRGFNTVADYDYSPASALVDVSNKQEEFTQPERDKAASADQLREWCEKHLPDKALCRQSADHVKAMADSLDNVKDIGDTDQNAMRCSEAMKEHWVLHAIGWAKHGDYGLEELAILSMDGHGLVFMAEDIDEDMRAAIQELIDQRIGTCVVHGYKEHLHFLESQGLHMPLPLFDTKLAGYLAEPDFHADNLEQAVAHFLAIPVEEEPEATQGALALDGREDEDERRRGTRILRQAQYVMMVSERLQELMDERHQYGLLRTIELPTSAVLAQMETEGAKVDDARLKEMHDRFAAEARQAQEIAWDRAGSRVNLQSPKQLSKVLFDDMGLVPTHRTKTGSYSTNVSVLQDLYIKSVNNERANDFLGALLKHRETNKLKQIVQTLREAVNPRDGRLHTTYEQTVAATGRLSSVDPNLQNIPNRDARGREIRSAFVPGSGYEALLSSDYSQVELRIMAHLSGDQALIDAFKSGADFHRYVASLVYDIPMEEVTGDQRSHVKAMSYGLAYGLSTYGLAQQLKISPAAADVLRAKYFATFGKVHEYLESLVADAREKGYTETMFGRRRYFPGLRSKRRPTREAAERAALNAPIQGSAADIMKIAMIKASRALSDQGLKSRISLQIHDELLVEIAPGETDKATKLVKDSMEHAVELAVPLDVSTGIGQDWELAAH